MKSLTKVNKSLTHTQLSRGRILVHNVEIENTETQIYYTQAYTH